LIPGSLGRSFMAAQSRTTMKTLLRIAYLAVLYGLLAFTSRAENSGFPGESSMVVENATVPEPGSIGLISLLVVLLAMQRQR
jgi:hypothetical protein